MITYPRKSSAYVLVSAMHKEIRRGDAARASAYARPLREIRGERYLRNYVRRIVLEETRNVELYLRTRQLYDWHEMVRDLASSVKRWELPGARDSYERELRCFQKAYELGPLSLSEAESFEADSFDEVRTLVFRIFVPGTPELIGNRLFPRFRDRYGNQLPVSWGLAAIQAMENDYHVWNLLVEAAFGYWSEQADEIREADGEVLGADIPAFEDYVYDEHVASGKARLQGVYDKIRPGKPLPKGVDLRWAGHDPGMLWRFNAFEQYGMDYRNRKWEEVEIDRAMFDLAMRCKELDE